MAYFKSCSLVLLLWAGLSYDTLGYSLLDESELLERCDGVMVYGCQGGQSRDLYGSSRCVLKSCLCDVASESMFVLHGMMILNLALESSSIHLLAEKGNRAATRCT